MQDGGRTIMSPSATPNARRPTRDLVATIVVLGLPPLAYAASLIPLMTLLLADPSCTSAACDASSDAQQGVVAIGCIVVPILTWLAALVIGLVRQTRGLPSTRVALIGVGLGALVWLCAVVLRLLL